jgi:hypothetical protein
VRPSIAMLGLEWSARRRSGFPARTLRMTHQAARAGECPLQALTLLSAFRAATCALSTRSAFRTAIP